jgi:NAD(P)-dependent dehydrogenase (short-subunit alcohol dehydrogenase family)
MLKLSGKIAIVTGAARGIGRAIALALAREGACIGIAARSESESSDRLSTIYSVAEEVERLGVKAVPVRTDVTKEEDVQTFVDTVVRKLGGIDILVNNAAVFPMYHTPLVDLPVKYWDLTMNVNLRGFFLCIKTALPHLMKRSGGSIINISSLAAVRAGKGRIAYGVSKAGVDRLTFGLSDEVKGYNIAVNALSPVGPTDTRAARGLFPEEDPGKWVQPDDMGRAAVWLARQNAETFTGRAVAVAPGGSALTLYGRSNNERMWFRID